jgi:hypothetical protein
VCKEISHHGKKKLSTHDILLYGLFSYHVGDEVDDVHVEGREVGRRCGGGGGKI